MWEDDLIFDNSFDSRRGDAEETSGASGLMVLSSVVTEEAK